MIAVDVKAQSEVAGVKSALAIVISLLTLGAGIGAKQFIDRVFDRIQKNHMEVHKLEIEVVRLNERLANIESQ